MPTPVEWAELAAQIGELVALLKVDRSVRDVEGLAKSGFPRHPRADALVDPNEAAGSYIVDRTIALELNADLFGTMTPIIDLDLRRGDDLRAWQFGLKLGLPQNPPKGGPSLWPNNTIPGMGQPAIKLNSIQPAGLFAAQAPPAPIPYGLQSQGFSAGDIPMWCRFWVGSSWYDRWTTWGLGQTFLFQAHATRVQIGFLNNSTDFPPGGIDVSLMVHAHCLPPGSFVPTPWDYTCNAETQNADPADPDLNIQGPPPGAEEWNLYLDERDTGGGPPSYLVRLYKAPPAPVSRMDYIIPAGSVMPLSMFGNTFQPWTELFQGIGVGETTIGVPGGKNWLCTWRAWTR